MSRYFFSITLCVRYFDFHDVFCLLQLDFIFSVIYVEPLGCVSVHNMHACVYGD